MAKLYFRHGTVGSAKTLNLLAVAHNYQLQKKKALLIKPAMDDRFGANQIQSRAGLKKEADILVGPETDLLAHDYEGIDCILVDEAQFLSVEVIEQLRKISTERGIPVICYGLRTDFRSHLFAGAQRLMELADSIEEVKSTCFYCNSKAVVNLKYVDGIPTREGPQVDLGAEEKYHPACYKCYSSILSEAREPALI